MKEHFQLKEENINIDNNFSLFQNYKKFANNNLISFSRNKKIFIVKQNKKIHQI